MTSRVITIPGNTAEVRVCADPAALSREAAELFVDFAAAAIKRSGRFAVALSGGSTPRNLYALLAIPPYRDRIPWPQTHFFWSDERCAPPDHPDSNYRMTREQLLSHVPVPDSNVHRMHGEDPDPAAAAAAYEKELRDFFHIQSDELPRFDLLLLGTGPDGHTASLFPGSPALKERQHLVAGNFVDKAHGSRLTLTFPVLNNAANIVFLVSGAEKAAILQHILGPADSDPLPAQRIRPTHGKLLWLVDRAAAALLPGGPRS